MASEYKIPGDIKECCINYVDTDDMVSVTLYEYKHIKNIIALKEAHPDEIKIVDTGLKGTFLAHLPKKYLHFHFGEKRKNNREMTDEQKAALTERLKTARESKASGKKAIQVE